MVRLAFAAADEPAAPSPGRGWFPPGWAAARQDWIRFLWLSLTSALAMAMVAAVIGLPRVLTWVLAKDVPWTVATPLVSGLLSLGLEVGMLIGWPLGYAEAAFRSRDRGEARVRESLGESPAARLMALWPVTLLLASLSVMASASWGMQAREPGRALQRMIDEARVACTGRAEGIAQVPVLGAAWLCTPTGPELVARAPGGAARPGAVVLTDRLEVAPDLRTMRAERAELLVSRDPLLHVRVAELHVVGLASYSAPSTVPHAMRGLLLAGTAGLCAMVSTWAILRGLARARWVAWVVGLVGPLVSLVVLRAIERATERGNLTFGVLLLVPAAGVVATVLVGWLAQWLPHLAEVVHQTRLAGRAGTEGRQRP